MSVEQAPTFEELRGLIAAASGQPDESRRLVRWVPGTGGYLAYTRDGEGRLEIFLAGPALRTVLPDVAKRLRYDRWERDGGREIEASRLLLPEGEHLDAVAATIIVELVRHGVASDLQAAFTRTEPLISMSLSGLDVQEAVITGLAGELLFLRLLRHLPELSPSKVLAMWKGHRRSSRDFQIKDLGVEVKTSITGESRHHIQGWYQVEAGVPAEPGLHETDLRLLSVGIQWLPKGVAGQSVADLVKENREGLTADEWRGFLTDVRGYGGGEIAIDENGDAVDEALARPFQEGFVRLYDLADPRVRLLTQGDLDDKPHVVTDSVSFEILLPKVVTSGNPVDDWSGVISVVRQHL